MMRMGARGCLDRGDGGGGRRPGERYWSRYSSRTSLVPPNIDTPPISASLGVGTSYLTTPSALLHHSLTSVMIPSLLKSSYKNNLIGLPAVTATLLTAGSSTDMGSTTSACLRRTGRKEPSLHSRQAWR